MFFVLAVWGTEIYKMHRPQSFDLVAASRAYVCTMKPYGAFGSLGQPTMDK